MIIDAALLGLVSKLHLWNEDTLGIKMNYSYFLFIQIKPTRIYNLGCTAHISTSLYTDSSQ